MSDTLWRGTALADTFRIFAVDCTDTTQKARDIHDLSPIATILMGKMIAAAAMLSLELKHEESDLTLTIDGEGALKGGLVICTAGGSIRGYIKEPHLQPEDPEENFHPGWQLGDGTLSVFKTIPNAQPWMGYTELVTGEVAEDLAHFFNQSEQIPSAVSLGILIDKNATIRACGGFIIQQLPLADAAKTKALIQNLNQTPNLSDLMDMGLSLHEIFERFVFKNMDWHLEESHPIRYQCNCSKERFARSLLTLGKEELNELKEGIEPECLYCKTVYKFDKEDILTLLEV